MKGRFGEFWVATDLAEDESCGLEVSVLFSSASWFLRASTCILRLDCLQHFNSVLKVLAVHLGIFGQLIGVLASSFASSPVCLLYTVSPWPGFWPTLLC